MAPLILTLALDKVVKFTPRPLPEFVGTHRTGGWVGPTAGPDILEKKQTSYPYRHSNSRPPNP